MPRSSKPRKKHTPRSRALPRIVNQQHRFATIEHMISQLETGELTEANGELIYYDFEEGAHFPLVKALAGWIVYVENLVESSRVRAPSASAADEAVGRGTNEGAKAPASGVEPDKNVVHAHKKLYHALKYAILIEPSLIAEVKAEIALHKQAYLRLTPTQARDLALKTRIMIAEQNLKETNHAP